jgi:cysteine desulfurase / selenocysteine lyase
VVEVVPNDESGQLSVEALRGMIDDRVKLIAITHVPTNGGLVNPAAAVGAIAREAAVPYLLDACQSVGQMPISVSEIGCDMLSATGRKFLRGPRGTGFLYVRRGFADHLEPPFLDLHAARWTSPNTFEVAPGARRFENWESNVAGKVGLGVAIAYARDWGIAAIWDRVRSLASRLRAELEEIPGVTMRDIGAERCGIVTFTTDWATPDEVKRRLRDDGINVSVTRRASTRLDMEARDLTEMVRASVHYYNDDTEIDRLCAALRELRNVAQPVH